MAHELPNGALRSLQSVCRARALRLMVPRRRSSRRFGRCPDASSSSLRPTRRRACLVWTRRVDWRRSPCSCPCSPHRSRSTAPRRRGSHRPRRSASPPAPRPALQLASRRGFGKNGALRVDDAERAARRELELRLDSRGAVLDRRDPRVGTPANQRAHVQRAGMSRRVRAVVPHDPGAGGGHQDPQRPVQRSAGVVPRAAADTHDRADAGQERAAVGAPGLTTCTGVDPHRERDGGAVLDHTCGVRYTEPLDGAVDGLA